MPDRTYSEREVARIIEVAAERQRSGGGAAETGLTLREIERIGRESGLDPAHLRAAARIVDATDGTREAEHDGKHLVVRRTLRGSISDVQWARFTDELVHAYGPSSDLGERIVRSIFPDRDRPDGVRTWQDKRFETRTTARAAEDADGTTSLVLRRQVSAVSPGIDAGLFGGLIALVVSGLGAAFAVAIQAGEAGLLWAMLLSLAAALAIAVPALLTRDRRARRREAARLGSLADDLALRVAGPPDESSRAPETPDRLDLDALDDPLADEDRQRDGRQRTR